MSMLKFNNKSIVLIALLLLGACQTVPKPASQPTGESKATVGASAPQPQPQAVEFNQQFYQQAIAALKHGDTKLAIELLQQVSFDAPGTPFVFTNLGLAYLKQQKFDLAEQAFQQAIKQNKRDAVAHNHLGILHRHQGNFDDARKRYQRAIDIDRDYARAHLNLGILFDIYLQDLKKALRQYQKYQALTSEEDSQVAGWIVDIQRRIKSTTTKSQG